MLPNQYFESKRSSTILSGEEKLFFAVLEDAVRCYVHAKTPATPSKQWEFVELREWFNERGGVGLFSFESVCANLDIDPECLRRRLDGLSSKDIPLQRFCNRRRLGARRPRTVTAFGKRVKGEPAGNSLSISSLEPLNQSAPELKGDAQNVISDCGVVWNIPSAVDRIELALVELAGEGWS
jgi:hypothetical protein